MSSNLEIRVIVVDSHPMLREGLRTTLNHHPLCSVVAEAGDITSAMYACSQHNHEVVLINYSMAPSEALKIVADFKLAFPSTRIVIGQMEADRGLMANLCEVGVTGFLNSNAETVEYTSAVISVWGGGLYFSAGIAQVLMQTDDRHKQSNALGLTTRELDVLELLASGYCNKEIANMRDISIRTVETHRLNIRKKTHTNTLSDLVRVAQELGLSAMGGRPKAVSTQKTPLLTLNAEESI